MADLSWKQGIDPFNFVDKCALASPVMMPTSKLGTNHLQNQMSSLVITQLHLDNSMATTHLILQNASIVSCPWSKRPINAQAPATKSHLRMRHTVDTWHSVHGPASGTTKRFNWESSVTALGKQLPCPDFDRWCASLGECQSGDSAILASIRSWAEPWFIGLRRWMMVAQGWVSDQLITDFFS